MHSLLASIRNRLRLWKLYLRALYVEASIANAEADMANRAAELIRCKSEYYRRVAVLRGIRREIDVREAPEVILKNIAKGNP